MTPVMAPCGNLPWPHAECVRDHPAPRPRRAGDGGLTVDYGDTQTAADLAALASAITGAVRTRMADAAHIARWNPARVLAEVEAKRLMLADHEHTTEVLNAYGPSAKNPKPIGCMRCHDWDDVTMGLGWCVTLCALAQPYADHPDFDPSWRPVAEP